MGEGPLLLYCSSGVFTEDEPTPQREHRTLQDNGSGMGGWTL